jgi:hypothetical protein
MKKLNLLFAAMLLFCTFNVFAQEELRPSTDPDFERAKTTIRPVWDYEGTITIDGKADEAFWDMIQPLELLQDVTMAWWSEGSKPIDPKLQEDGIYHLSFKITMDEEYFYIFCEIIDDNLQSRSMHTDQNSWLNDNVELFFLFADETVVMPDWALTEASQLRIYVDLNEQTGDTLEAGGWAAGIIGTEKYRPQGYRSKTVATDNGFNVEARIPFGLIVPSDEDGNLGYFDDDDNWIPIVIKELEMFQFDIMGADRDEGRTHPEGEPRHFFANWSANWSRNWGFTEGYGIATVGAPLNFSGVPDEARPTTDPRFSRGEATIRPLGDYTGEIEIDGKGDEAFWSMIDPMTLNFDVTDAWFTNGMKPIDPDIISSGDYNLTWKMTLDDDFFYILCDVTDDELVSRSMVTGQDQWVNDNVELFFLFADESVVMPDWALGEASQVRIWADLNAATSDSVTAGGWAGGMIANQGMMDYKSRTVLTDKGYTIETRIPLKLIVPTDESGNFGYYDDDDNFIPIVISEMTDFQFDIQVADRDDATAEGARKYLWQWSATWNRNWGFTEGYGIVSVGQPLFTTNVEGISQSSIRVFPNPASNRLTIENLGQTSYISIINLVGQEVYRTSTNDARITLDIDSLNNGLYIINITNDSGSRVVEKFIKK